MEKPTNGDGGAGEGASPPVGAEGESRVRDAKRIVVCSDGTGNTAIKGRGTNVFKTYEAVDVNGHRLDPTMCEQVAIYDDGVGTEKLRAFRLVAGAFGIGLARNVRKLYAEVCRQYEPGDKLFFFGFSRGAFTVRTLAGLIADCGVVRRDQWRDDADLRRKANAAYRARRKRKPALLGRLFQIVFDRDREGAVRRFRKENSYASGTDEPKIEFIGVWDTVDAVGFPHHGVALFWNTVIYRYKFPDQKLHSTVRRACQVLSIDEARRNFKPRLWDVREEKREDDREIDRIEQVWFPGVHSNVGGGYPKQGMSLATLDWMLRRAEGAGLRFHPHVRNQYGELQHSADKLYDSRAGAGVAYPFQPRHIANLCSEYDVDALLHISAVERIVRGVDGYAPGNLPENLEVVGAHHARNGAEQPHPPVDNLEHLQRIGERLGTALDAGERELASATKWILMRQLIYWMAVGSSAMVTFMMGFRGWSWLRGSKMSAVEEALEESVVGPALALTGGIYGLLISLAGVLVVAWLAGAVARAQMERVYSRFWRRVVASESLLRD